MNTRDFPVFLEPDLDYCEYVVVCPPLSGGYSQGKTFSEAPGNIREAIESDRKVDPGGKPSDTFGKDQTVEMIGVEARRGWEMN
jgi:hypothetical protein